MEIQKSTILSYYKREDVQNTILENAKSREVAIRFGEKGYGKRPDILKYKRDVLELAIRGATSFHVSEERWLNPLKLRPGMKKEDQDENRIGWDFILDIDCPYFEYSKQTAYMIIEYLKHHNIKSISCKFSGNKGFHIGIPFEAFPQKIGNIETKYLFPEAPRRIALFIQDKIKDLLAKQILEMEKNDINKVIQNVEINKEDIIKPNNKGGFDINAEAFVDIDTVLISSRHLYRSALSLHEKSGLISVPINPDKVLDFKREFADPTIAKKFNFKFLDASKSKNSECTSLVTEAYDFQPELKENEKEEKIYHHLNKFEEAVPKEFFPPCIVNILKGLRDGKKRALFILTNYLLNVGWNLEDIETLIEEWNKKNPETLRKNIIMGHLNYKKKNKKILPPNCEKSIYKDLGICVPENLCKMIKNPVNFSMRKIKK